MNRRRSIFVGLLFWVFVALLAMRSREQLNYGQLHVRFSEETGGSVAKVDAIGFGGLVRPLTRREDDRNTFSQFGPTGALTSFRVYSKDGISVIPSVEEIRIGENWRQPSWQVPLRQGPLPVAISLEPSEHQLSGAVSEYIPAFFSRLNSLDPHDGFNWQGDQWLLVTPLLQALLFLLVPWYLCRFIRQIATFAGSQSDGEKTFEFNEGRLAVCGRLPVSLVLAFGSLLVLQQFWSQVQIFYGVRWGNQFLAFALLLTAVGTMIFAYCRRIVSLPEDRKRLQLAGLFLLMAGALKVLWILWLDSDQTGDYKKYLSYGQQMAADDWSSFEGRWYAFAIFLRRAYVWLYPLLSITGGGQTAIEVSNVVLQLLTAMMFLWLVSRMFCVSVACCSLPFLLLYPGFWYAPTVVSHNTPGYFWLLAVWCLFEILRRLEESPAIGTSASMRMLFEVMVCLSLGICMSLLELTKSYRPILLLSVASIVILAQLSRYMRVGENSGRYRWFRCQRIWLFVGAACVISVSIERTVDAMLVAKAGPSAPSTFLEQILSVDSQTDGSAPYLNWWKRDYFPIVSGPAKTELAVRKLLHEKLTGGILTFTGILLKNSFYSLQCMDYAHRTFGSLKGTGEGLQETRRVPWYGMQIRTSYTVSSFLLLATVIRCLLAPLFPVTRSELFPLCFCSGGFMALVLVAESCPYYGEIAVFPMIWTTGLLLERLCRSLVAERMPQTNDAKIRLHLRYLLRGAAGLVFVVTMWIVVGRWAEKMESGFLGISSIPATTPAERPNSDPIVTVSRSRAAIRFSDQLQVLHAGEEISHKFALSAPGPSTTQRLEFFVTGDMRARAIPMMKAEVNLWKGVPIEYSVAVNGKVVSQGALEEIFRAVFLDIPSSFFVSADLSPSDDVIVELKLRCTKDISIPPSIQTALAFEYPFYRDGAADSGSNNMSSEQGSDIRVYKQPPIVSR